MTQESQQGRQDGLAADELLDTVDERDRVTGQRRRAEVYAHGLRHRCTAIRVRDGEGRIFVHRRTPEKLIFPSMYDVVVGGVVGAGEDYDTAALREAEEELGVRGLPLPELRLKFLFQTPEVSWFIQVYEVVCTLPVRPQPEEVAWWDFLTEDELERRLPTWDVVPDGLECHRRLDAARG
ncbi:NUDIX domain-containing protein [Streptomyces sp. NHF165]|uniref:NUDIX domain-containing protein n=1 Tax=unclassified Streptomyces TaxID=2593676 RepID=UPI0004CABAFA|nr:MULTISPECIES: NUDIX domain-containing protein [unclassified Streptomyces]QHF98443.1 NUDIX domain-containing protein [Streptomyces sp. NHF165]